jgi:hypothetical protein
MEKEKGHVLKFDPRVSQGEHFSLRLRVSCNRVPLSVVYIALLDYQVLYPVLTNYRIVICVYIPYAYDTYHTVQ